MVERKKRCPFCNAPPNARCNANVTHGKQRPDSATNGGGK